MTDLDASDLMGFVSAARARGVTRAIVAWQDEYAQVSDTPADGYSRVRRSTVLAYAAGTIIRWTVDGDAADRRALGAALAKEGFTVDERCRNLGSSEHAG